MKEKNQSSCARILLEEETAWINTSKWMIENSINAFLIYMWLHCPYTLYYYVIVTEKKITWTWSCNCRRSSFIELWRHSSWIYDTIESSSCDMTWINRHELSVYCNKEKICSQKPMHIRIILLSHCIHWTAVSDGSENGSYTFMNWY